MSLSIQVSKDTILNQLSIAEKQILDLGLDTSFALIIDGKALGYALEDAMKGKFLQIALKCASVICCRVSPKQKALVCMAFIRTEVSPFFK
jgi:phospholipid-translocating ATPase